MSEAKHEFHSQPLICVSVPVCCVRVSVQVFTCTSTGLPVNVPTAVFLAWLFGHGMNNT